MAVKPPKDRQISDKLISGISKFLGSGLYFLFLLFGLMVIFAKFGTGAETIAVYFFTYGFLATVPRWLIKKKFRVYEYDPRYMSASEAQARADLGLPEPGSVKGVVYGLGEISEHFKKLKNDPHYSREFSNTLANRCSTEEACKEATIPFYKTTKKINEACSAPVVWYAKGLIKFELFIWRQLKKLSKR